MLQRSTLSGEQPSPVRNAITDRVYAILRGRIIDLALPPGERLGIERLSRDLDVSPTPVREALNRLTSEGLVVQEPYRGFKVSELLDPRELDDLLVARSIIETEAAESAASNRSAADLERLRELVATMDYLSSEDVVNVKEFNASDAAFHHTLIASGTNRFLVRAFEALHAHEQISRQFKGQPPVRARRANSEHAKLVDALANADGEAARSLAGRHIETVRDALQIAFRKESHE